MKVTELQAKKRNSPYVLLPHQTSLDYMIIVSLPSSNICF